MSSKVLNLFPDACCAAGLQTGSTKFAGILQSTGMGAQLAAAGVPDFGLDVDAFFAVVFDAVAFAGAAGFAAEVLCAFDGSVARRGATESATTAVIADARARVRTNIERVDRILIGGSS